MFDIIKMGSYNVLHLTDGNLLPEAVAFVDKGKADGINLNYIRNWRTDLEPLRQSKKIKYLIVNDYPKSRPYDYSAIYSLNTLLDLSIYTSDKKEIDFSAFPNIENISLKWRSKASSLFKCVQLKELFLGNYTAKALTLISNLKNLKYLRINLGSVVSLNGLGELEGLEELMLMQVTKLEDIEDILKLKHLKRLMIYNCKCVKNITSIKKMNIAQLEILGTTPNN